jgi:hypothetical protein
MVPEAFHAPLWELSKVEKLRQRRRGPTVPSHPPLANGMILLGPLASRRNRIPTTVLFAYLTIFLPRPVLRLPQRVIEFLMPLHRSQTAYLVDGIGGFLYHLTAESFE